MNPLDGFFYVWQVEYVIGPLNIFLGFPCCLAWFPFTVSLGQWYAVSATFISSADENGFLWHVINTSSSLYIVTPSFLKMDTSPLSAVFPTPIRYFGDYLNVSASAALLESCVHGSLVTYLLLHAPPLVTPTFLADTRNIGKHNFFYPLL